MSGIGPANSLSVVCTVLLLVDGLVGRRMVASILITCKRMTSLPARISAGSASVLLGHSLRDEPRNGWPSEEHNQQAQGLQRHHEGQIGVAAGANDGEGVDAARTGRRISGHRIDPGALHEHQSRAGAYHNAAADRQ